ncbi:MAG TPA: hypothetical protein VF210_06600 [Pseudomonadales bacterium]
MSATPPEPDPDLIARVAASAGLSPGVARRIVEDVLAHHAVALDDYVVRRHRELAAAGWKNPDIFEQLRGEIASRLFKGPSCSARQIRRMIYG